MNNLENNKRHSIFTYDGNAIYSTAFPNDAKKLYPVIIIKLLSPSVAFDVHISDMYTIFNHNDLDKKYFYPGTYTLTNNKEYKCMLYFKDISEEIIGVFRISFSDILGNKYFQDVSFSYHDECISQYKFEIINVLRPHHINEINNCKIEDITKSEFNYLYNECNID